MLSWLSAGLCNTRRLRNAGGCALRLQLFWHVVADQPSAELLFPINALRNYALLQARRLMLATSAF